MILGEHVKQEMPITIPFRFIGIRTRKKIFMFIVGVDITYSDCVPLLDENIMIIDVSLN